MKFEKIYEQSWKSLEDAKNWDKIAPILQENKKQKQKKKRCARFFFYKHYSYKHSRVKFGSENNRSIV